MNILFIVKDIDIEHLNIMILSQVLKNAGHKVMICPAVISKAQRLLKKTKVEIIAYSVPSVYLYFYLRFNQQIKKEYDIFSIFGGPHPTLVPEMIDEQGVDCICRGEGEAALLELAEALAQGRPINQILNLWVKQNDQIYKNPLRSLIEDLDSLPFADRELFPWGETAYKGKMHVLTSRGCPYSCAYCCQPAYAKIYGKTALSVRRRSVKNVCKEIQETVEKTKIRLVMFEDDLFVSDPKWIEEFCREYKQQFKIPFFCYFRADLISSDLVKKLRGAGCVGMSMGVETANPRIRAEILCRKMSNQQIINAAKIIKQQGIRLETLNIVGIPNSTLQDDFDTLKLNSLCQADFAAAKLMMPYPGTRIREFAQKQNLLNTDRSCFQGSLFDFSSKQEKRARENLRSLFSLGVEFPFLVPLIKKIIYWPLGKGYEVISLFWEGYVSFFRLYPTGIKGAFWGLKKYFRLLGEVVCFRIKQ